MADRIDVICDLLLGAAYADDQFHDREKRLIRGLIGDLVGGDLPAAVDAQIEGFDPAAFDVGARARAFASDPEANHRMLLELIAAVHEADDEFDFREDDYLRAVAEAIGADPSVVASMSLEYEVEELKAELPVLRASPPPVPQPGGAIDIDFD